MRRLNEVLDQENYHRLVIEFGGKRVWIPKIGNLGYRDRKYILSRNSEIINLFRNGKSIKELAQSFRISVKRVYGIVEEVDRNGRRKNMYRRGNGLRMAM